jgi:hydrogenase small subunit
MVSQKASGTLLAGLDAFADRHVSRRTFLRFCAAMTALLALPASFESRVVAAVSTAPRLPLVWLRGQGCGGDSEALLRTANPGIAELLLGSLSVDYLETLMASTGSAAEDARNAVLRRYPGGYIAIVEGAVATADEGVHHTVGGRAFRDVVREVCDGARATIAVGSCAFDGGLSRADGGTTESTGVVQVVANPKFVALPGCPMNVANLAATIVHYLTFESLPSTDSRGRPLFAYGALLHNLCERRPHFEFGEFVRDWGDEGAQKGWCLYQMGCKGPESFANCATVRYDESTTWPVQAGHGCIGCVMPDFWDSMGPAYERLPGWVPFNPQVTADDAGIALVGGVAALAGVHGAASIVRSKLGARAERRAAAGGAAAVGAAAGPSASPIAVPLAAPTAAPTTVPTPAPPSEAPAPATPTDNPTLQLPGTPANAGMPPDAGATAPIVQPDGPSQAPEPVRSVEPTEPATPEPGTPESGNPDRGAAEPGTAEPGTAESA